MTRCMPVILRCVSSHTHTHPLQADGKHPTWGIAAQLDEDTHAAVSSGLCDDRGDYLTVEEEDLEIIKKKMGTIIVCNLRRTPETLLSGLQLGTKKEDNISVVSATRTTQE